MCVCVCMSSWHKCSGCTENLTVQGCVWAERLHGPQAWMSHSTWTHVLESRCKNKNSFTSAAALGISLQFTRLNCCDTLVATLPWSLTLGHWPALQTSLAWVMAARHSSLMFGEHMDGVIMCTSYFCSMLGTHEFWMHHMNYSPTCMCAEKQQRWHTWMARRTVTGSEPRHKYMEGSWSQGPKFSSLQTSLSESASSGRCVMIINLSFNWPLNSQEEENSGPGGSHH